MIMRLAAVVADATSSFEEHDYTRALERAEDFFGGTATTTSSWSRDVATITSRRPPPGRAARCSPRCLSSSGCSPLSCRSSPRRSGHGGRRDPCTTHRGLTRRG